jgi:glycosyltransferase involved in cell wall biosynthesis
MIPDAPDVVLVGPVAPPRGGIAAHVERLAATLHEFGVHVAIFNHFAATDRPLVVRALRRNPLRYWLSMRRLQGGLVHYHHSGWSVLLAAAAAKGSHSGTWIVTFHGHQIEYLLTSKLPAVARLTRWSIARFDHIVTVSKAVGEVVTAKTGRTVTIAPAYMPAPSAHLAQDPAEVPTVVVAASGTATGQLDDIYGLDIAAAVIAAAHASMPDLHLELYLAQPPGSRSQRYLDTVLGPASAANSREQVTIHIDKDLTLAFRPGAVFLRPTRTDGDSVSIREAINAGIPVLASKMACRPPGVVTLPLNDVGAWVAALQQAITSPGSTSASLAAENNGLLSLYCSLLDQTKTPSDTATNEALVP